MKKIILLFLMSAQLNFLTAQVGIGTANPNTNAILDLSSSSKGILIPRLTAAERNSISSPAEGLMIFNTNTSSLEIYSKGAKSARLHLDFSTGSTTTGGGNAWQEFTPTTSGYISKITLKQRNPQNPPTTGPYEFEMKILSGVTGYNLSVLNGGKVIGYSSIVIPAGSSPSDYSTAEYDYIFSPGVYVEANTKYWFQIYDLTNTRVYGDTYKHSSDVYPNHLAYVGGIGNDIYFKLHLQPIGPLFWKAVR
jgi:hypothetical protein